MGAIDADGRKTARSSSTQEIPIREGSHTIVAPHRALNPKRGAFPSVVELEVTINRFVEEHNDSPKPFVWHAYPDEIIVVRSGGCQALEAI